MYSKPLASRMDGVQEGPAKAKHSQSGKTNFAAFMPQGGVPGGAVPAITAMPAASGGIQMPGQNISPLEQAATQGNFGLNQMRAMAALATANANAGESAPGAEQAPNQGPPLTPRDLLRLLSRNKSDAESAETALRVKSHRKSKKAQSETQSQTQAENVVAKAVSKALDTPGQKTDAIGGDVLGSLAARFESGGDGIAAIGYDRHGGTSYGQYQNASRRGTMTKFIWFLKTEAPDMAERLESAGPANTGGKRGKMPETWRKIAEEDPDRFEALQDKFIRTSHFEPDVSALEESTGIAFNDMPAALHEVVFSTAVQHGVKGAERIVSRSLDQVGTTKLDPGKNSAEDVAKAQETLIRRIYSNRSGQFRSSTETVQASVKNRLNQEMSMAISMLRNGYAEA